MPFLASFLKGVQVSGSLIFSLWLISGLFDPWGKAGVLDPPKQRFLVTLDGAGLSIPEDLLVWVLEGWISGATSGNTIGAGGHLLDPVPYFGFGAYV